MLGRFFHDVIGQQVAAMRRLPWLFRSLWDVDPKLVIVLAAIRLLRALQPPAALYLGKLIIDEILAQSALPPPGPDLGDWLASGRLDTLGVWLLLEFLLAAGVVVLARLSALVETVLSDRHSNAMTGRLILHAADLDLAQLEASETQNMLQRARTQTLIGNGLLSMVLTQCQDLITVIALIAGMTAFLPVLILVLAAALIPTVIAEAHFNALGYSASRRMTQNRRAIEYLRFVGAAPETVKEVKLFGLGRYLRDRFQTAADEIYLLNYDISRRRAIWASLFAILSSGAYYACYLVVAWKTVAGALSIGDLTFLSGALLRLNSMLQSVMRSLTQIANQSVYLNDLYSFLDLAPGMARAADPASPTRGGGEVVFEDVGFRYPGKESWAVRGISFSIKAGDTLALVGENGAGKTTIVKLLTRLYDPDEGRVLVDGVDLREIDLDAHRRRLGVIFQDFVRYHFSVSENIAVGDVSAVGDRARITEAAGRSGADAVASRLPLGYDQLLGQRFESGVELSGGEWQKIALARGYFRDADILVLDEPTAALDARAEAEIFEKLRALGQGKTAVLVSHRFSTVRTADTILVLDGGRIIESGNHRALMALDGQYAELFRLQAQGYQ